MKIRDIIKTAAAGLFLAALLTGCSAGNTPASAGESGLLDALPSMDTDLYNRFLFSAEATAVTGDGSSTVLRKGVLETWRGVSHLYGTAQGPEVWVDPASCACYEDYGDGWRKGAVSDYDAIGRLEDTINKRTDATVSENGGTYTLSWKFSPDMDWLLEFAGGIPSRNMEGSGRATAVFAGDPYELQYLAFVASASDGEGNGVLLDAALVWEAKNSKKEVLVLPDSVAEEAYLLETGVSAGGGYDPVVNPMAESLVADFGGTAEVSCHGDGAYLFWTLPGETSVTVSYLTGGDPGARFTQWLGFMESLYGEAAGGDGYSASFYDKESGQLVYMAYGDGWYAEVTVTGSPGTEQGVLMKPLIDYRVRLGI